MPTKYPDKSKVDRKNSTKEEENVWETASAKANDRVQLFSFKKIIGNFLVQVYMPGIKNPVKFSLYAYTFNF